MGFRSVFLNYRGMIFSGGKNYCLAPPDLVSSHSSLGHSGFPKAGCERSGSFDMKHLEPSMPFGGPRCCEKGDTTFSEGCVCVQELYHCSLGVSSRSVGSSLAPGSPGTDTRQQCHPCHCHC